MLKRNKFLYTFNRFSKFASIFAAEKVIIKIVKDMKKVTNYVIAALCVSSIAFSAGTFMKVNAATTAVTATPGQPVDLTYAAEKALPAVVHIKYVQNSKTTTVDVQDDPFGGFFDPFGFFGNPGNGNGGTRKQKVQTPKKEATGSGVIISSDGYIVPTTTWWKVPMS